MKKLTNISINKDIFIYWLTIVVNEKMIVFIDDDVSNISNYIY